MLNLLDTAMITLEKNMGLKEYEEVLIVTDTPMQALGEIFFEAAVKLGVEVQQINFLPRLSNGEDPPAAVAEALKSVDIALLITSKSLSHTRARKAASQKGTRIASMPGLTEDMIQRTLAVDYFGMQEKCSYLAEILNKGKFVNLTTEQGTDISFSIDGREAHVDGGIYTKPGAFGNLPAGEVYIAPLEGTARGKIVVNGSIAAVGKLDEPLVMLVENGIAVTANGGVAADKINEVFNKYGKQSRNIAELGIGVHPQAKLTGFILEDEKIDGSVHMALGDNSTFGGKVEVSSHLDAVILNPTLEVDEKVIIDKGKWV